MMNLNQIQARIEATKSTGKITSALKLISASEYPRILNKKKNYDLFVENFDKVVKIIANNCKEACDKYNQQINNGQKNTNLIILFFSKRGLCGDFNKKVEQKMLSTGVFQLGLPCDVIVVGKHGFSIVKKAAANRFTTIKLIREFPLDSYAEIDQIEAFLSLNINTFVNTYSKIFVVYNRFKSLFSCQSSEIELFSQFEKLSAAAKPNNETMINLMTDQKDLFETFDKFLIHKILSVLYNTIVSEVSSRFITTDQASTNAKKQIEKLQMKYNKLRQAGITKEISELCTAAFVPEDV